MLTIISYLRGILMMKKKETTVADVSLQRSSMMQCSSTIEDTSFIENTRDATTQAEVSTGQQQPGNVSVSQTSAAALIVAQAAQKKRKDRKKKPTSFVTNPGETDEAILFCHTAKLFLFNWAQKEWMEQGVGKMKILYHPGSNSYRLLFRMRDLPFMQVVCNHRLNGDMIMKPVNSSKETAWMWVAIDFSHGQPTKRHFAARFTTPEMASLFHVKVLECQAALRAVPAGPVPVPPPGNPGEDKEMMDRDVEGRRLRKMENLKIIDDYDMPPQVSTSSASILSSNSSEQQQPGNVSVSQTTSAVPILAQAAQKSTNLMMNPGETADEAILFCRPAKLFSFDSAQKEWMEQGVGDMKILHHPGINSYRILFRMRNSPCMVVCNHRLDLELILRSLHCSETAWMWMAMDFSQGQLVERHFSASFTTPELASLFKSKVLECQEALWAVSAGPVPVPPPGNSGEDKEMMDRDEEARVLGKMENLKIIDDYDIDQLLEEIDFVVRQGDWLEFCDST